ncbi:MAG: hypothetical protein AAF663_05635 [Planctomycetota bacterium]
MAIAELGAAKPDNADPANTVTTAAAHHRTHDEESDRGSNMSDS